MIIEIMPKTQNNKIAISTEQIVSKIFSIRDRKAMLDRDIAELYGVKSIALRQQVKRNLDRFPSDFMFQLTEHEIEVLVSQNVIPSKKQLGGFLPYAFTEQGVAMLSSALRSKQAIYVNIQIMRAFTQLRTMLIGYRELKKKIEEMESKYDWQFREVFEAIKQLIIQEEEPRAEIGFR